MTFAFTRIASARIVRFVLILSFTLLPGLLAAAAQQPNSAGPAASHSIRLTVVVNAKSGQPAVSLTQRDFTILDNKSPRPITSFKVMNAGKERVSVIFFLDAVNTPFEMASYMNQGVEKYLQENEGKLAYPAEIAILTDDGVKFGNGFSTNGLALNDDLKHQSIDLRTINRSSQWSGSERLNISLNAFHQLLTYTSDLPGRKIVLWISPGWPLLSGSQASITEKQTQQIFSTIVSFSTEMRQNNVTLYNINPVGVGQSLLSANYYEDFLKGVAKPNDAQVSNLGIQVLAVQSGGLTIVSDSDVAGNIQRCLTDAESWYEITFNPPPADKPNQYHHIEVKLDLPGLVARTRDGYYSNAQFIQSH